MSGVLEHSQADIVRHVLIAINHGTLPSGNEPWPIYVDNEPDAPDNCITITNTPSRDFGRDAIQYDRQEYHGIQIRIRAATSPLGRNKARRLAIALDAEIIQHTIALPKVPGVEEADYLIHSVTRTGDVLSLGKEVPNTKRHLFTLNAIVAIRQVLT